LLAAKAAQMKTVVIPEHSMAGDGRFVTADQQLASLQELTQELPRSL
jgi:sugar-phosphatase